MSDFEMYKEYTVSVSNVNFTFFIDGGFYQKIGYNSSSRHSHLFNELIYVFSGSVRIVTESDAYTVNARDLIVIPRDTPHSIHSDDDTCFTVISFWEEENILREFLRIKSFKASDVFLRLLDYYYNDYTYKGELIYSCIYEISAHILEANLKGKTMSEGNVTLENNNYRKYIIEHYLNSNFNKHPSVEGLSRQLHLCTLQMQRIIKQMYGMTFTQKLLELRIKHSIELLVKTDLPISKIAVAAGYTTTHNFFSKFKAVTGMTPLQYRKKHQEKDGDPRS